MTIWIDSIGTDGGPGVRIGSAKPTWRRVFAQSAASGFDMVGTAVPRRENPGRDPCGSAAGLSGVPWCVVGDRDADTVRVFRMASLSGQSPIIRACLCAIETRSFCVFFSPLNS